ncbi:MAG: DNA-protecting protein DprA [Gammaproteobacteria bacterium]|nr:DNA-protecting protein DprA [Gammaproteobacteria bacterium]
MDQELENWLVLHHTNLGPQKIFNWLKHFQSPSALRFATHSELVDLGIVCKDIERLRQSYEKDIAQDKQWLNEANHSILSFTDLRYPLRLKQIAVPPLILYVQGNVATLATDHIAIVGSRQASFTGLRNAKQFATVLARSGFTITSGLAYGVDAASHQGALDAQGLTVAVAGTGLHHFYPKMHAKLGGEIIKHRGAIISEFSLDTPPLAKNFPQRNRIIAGLARGVLVVEAAIKSGSLITARLALDEGREVFAIPGSIHQPLVRGCHHLIKQGAKLVENANDILEEFGLTLFNLTPIATIDSHLEKGDAELLGQIDYEITPTDVIILRSPLSESEVAASLLRLELAGFICSIPGGYIRC